MKGHCYTCWFTTVYYSSVTDYEWGQTDNWITSMSRNNNIRFITISLFLLYNSVVWINEENHITFKTSLIGCVVSSITFLKLPAIWHWEQVCQDYCWANSNLPKQMEIQQGDMEKLSDDPSPSYPCGLRPLSLISSNLLFGILEKEVWRRKRRRKRGIKRRTAGILVALRGQLISLLWKLVQRTWRGDWALTADVLGWSA